jgi:hypothetical protein
MPLQVINVPTKLMPAKVKGILSDHQAIHDPHSCELCLQTLSLWPYNACVEKFIAKAIVVIFSSSSYSRTSLVPSLHCPFDDHTVESLGRKWLTQVVAHSLLKTLLTIALDRTGSQSHDRDVSQIIVGDERLLVSQYRLPHSRP